MQKDSGYSDFDLLFSAIAPPSLLPASQLAFLPVTFAVDRATAESTLASRNWYTKECHI